MQFRFHLEIPKKYLEGRAYPYPYDTYNCSTVDFNTFVPHDGFDEYLYQSSDVVELFENSDNIKFVNLMYDDIQIYDFVKDKYLVDFELDDISYSDKIIYIGLTIR